jgi:hypothetical protein
MMGILKNTTEGIYPYQQAMLNKISGGFKHGEMMILSAGRRTGKSYYGMAASMSINKIKFMKLAEAQVDGEPWYSLVVGKEAAAWLRTQDNSVSTELSDRVSIPDHSVFDVHETIYTMMVLKFS